MTRSRGSSPLEWISVLLKERCRGPSPLPRGGTARRSRMSRSLTRRQACTFGLGLDLRLLILQTVRSQSELPSCDTAFTQHHTLSGLTQESFILSRVPRLEGPTQGVGGAGPPPEHLGFASPASAPGGPDAPWLGATSLQPPPPSCVVSPLLKGHRSYWRGGPPHDPVLADYIQDDPIFKCGRVPCGTGGMDFSPSVGGTRSHS